MADHGDPVEAAVERAVGRLHSLMGWNALTRSLLIGVIEEAEARGRKAGLLEAAKIADSEGRRWAGIPGYHDRASTCEVVAHSIRAAAERPT